jgi:hypothetical protein
MFESTKTKKSSLVKKMVKAQGQPDQDKPIILAGRGSINNSLTFFYQPNSPDYKAK